MMDRMTATRANVVSVAVVTTNEHQATRAAEVFARAAAGLLLEGIMVGITMSQVEDADESS